MHKSQTILKMMDALMQYYWYEVHIVMHIFMVVHCYVINIQLHRDKNLSKLPVLLSNQSYCRQLGGHYLLWYIAIMVRGSTWKLL